MWNQGPVKQFGEDFNDDVVCPVVYSSPPTSGPQQPRGGSGPQMPRGPSGSGPLQAVGSGPSSRVGGGSGVLDAASDRASLADDYSLPSSPAHSTYSDAGSINASPLHDDFRQRRVSLDQASEPSRRGPAGPTRGERKGFLSRDQVHLPPMRAGSPLFEPGPFRPPALQGGSPLFTGSPVHSTGGSSLNRQGSPGGTPLFAGSPAASSPGAGAGSDGGSPMFPSQSGSFTVARPDDTRTGSPLFAPHMQHSMRGGSATASPVHHRNTSGLREQVLIRSSSGKSSELSRMIDARHAEDDISDSVQAECLNFSETESVCQEKELEKDILEGLLIVPLPAHLGFGAGSSEHVLYALFFSGQDQKPLLPGDDSIRLLFPQPLQAAAEGLTQKGPARNDASLSPFSDCKPYKAPTEGLPAPNKGTPIATFGQYKPMS